MQAVLLKSQSAPTSSTSPCSEAIEHLQTDPPELQLQVFCQLQIEQLLSQIPGLCAELVYQPPGQTQRQTFTYGTDLRSRLDAEAQAFISSECWITTVGRLEKVLTRSQHRFYICALNHATEYLLIGTRRILSTVQRQLIETCALLLSHHLSTVKALFAQRQAQQQLEQKIHQINHQLRNPIALIQLYAELLLSMPTETQPRSHLETIQSSIQDINFQVKQLTTPQKSLEIKSHDLSEILTKSLKQLQPWLSEKQLIIERSQSPVLLDVDACQLKQVFDNLLTNAIHFSPDAGTIRCSWRVLPHEVLIEIRDQGRGLTETDLQQLFTPFYSRRPNGTGLGLAIAQGIVQAHHGRLWASNSATGGAKFSFTLPRHPKLSIVPHR